MLGFMNLVLYRLLNATISTYFLVKFSWNSSLVSLVSSSIEAQGLGKSGFNAANDFKQDVRQVEKCSPLQERRTAISLALS